MGLPFSNEPPCGKNCTLRDEDCHSKCPAYLEFRAKKDKELEERDRRRQADLFYDSVKGELKHHSWKNQKWHGR
jgi:hypothetical protein